MDFPVVVMVFQTRINEPKTLLILRLRRPPVAFRHVARQACPVEVLICVPEMREIFGYEMRRIERTVMVDFAPFTIQKKVFMNETVSTAELKVVTQVVPVAPIVGELRDGCGTPENHLWSSIRQ
jgi:hypothetical protein